MIDPQSEKLTRVSAVQFRPELHAVSNNIRAIEDLIADTTCDLLVLPELASTGYMFSDRKQASQLAETVNDGEFCGWMQRTATEKSMIIVGGFAERDGDSVFNSALIALPDGNVHVYRKTHLFYKETIIFDKGDTGFFVVEHGGIKVGTMICYDWRFPESARTLALRGADIIAHPSNLVADAQLWSRTISTRAIENKVPIATANRWGSETLDGETLLFSGCTQITGMNGAAVAAADAQGDVVVTAEISLIASRNKSINQFNDLFSDRRPDMYES